MREGRAVTPSARSLVSFVTPIWAALHRLAQSTPPRLPIVARINDRPRRRSISDSLSQLSRPCRPLGPPLRLVTGRSLCVAARRHVDSFLQRPRADPRSAVVVARAVAVAAPSSDPAHRRRAADVGRAAAALHRDEGPHHGGSGDAASAAAAHDKRRHAVPIDITECDDCGRKTGTQTDAHQSRASVQSHRSLSGSFCPVATAHTSSLLYCYSSLLPLQPLCPVRRWVTRPGRCCTRWPPCSPSRPHKKSRTPCARS